MLATARCGAEAGTKGCACAFICEEVFATWAPVLLFLLLLLEMPFVQLLSVVAAAPECGTKGIASNRIDLRVAGAALVAAPQLLSLLLAALFPGIKGAAM